MTEFVVIVSLMGAGLKLDHLLSFAGWQTSWRLLGISMPLTIAGIAFLGWSILGLGIASALLLGAALAPTDPVLASDIQVGPPKSGEEDEVRFALTSEAGLNDGAAFPFVHLAIAIALSQASGKPFFADWFLADVIWKIAAGIAIGWLGGKIMGYTAARDWREPKFGSIFVHDLQLLRRNRQPSRLLDVAGWQLYQQWRLRELALSFNPTCARLAVGSKHRAVVVADDTAQMQRRCGFTPARTRSTPLPPTQSRRRSSA